MYFRVRKAACCCAVLHQLVVSDCILVCASVLEVVYAHVCGIGICCVFDVCGN